MASSVKLFQFFQKIQQIIGVAPYQRNPNQRLINAKNIIHLAAAIQLLLTSIMFLILEAESMFTVGLAFSVTVNATAGIIIYVLLFIRQRKNTVKFIEYCEGFIEKRVHSTSEYKEIARNIELLNKYFVILNFVTIIIVCLAPLPYTIIRFYIYDMGDESYYLILNTWYPFNWRTPFGYLAAVAAQFIGVFAVSSILTQNLNLFFAACWLFYFIARDITKDATAFNSDVAQPSHGNRAVWMKRFCDLIQIYSDAKQCVKDFKQIYEFPLLTFFTWYILSISGLLVTIQFELWDDNANLVEMIILVYIALLLVPFIFLVCEPSQFCINQFEEFGEQLGHCDWYALPIELQRMYMVFLSETQNPFMISSYGEISCERETTKKILHKTFSYFMTFRKFK